MSGVIDALQNLGFTRYEVRRNHQRKHALCAAGGVAQEEVVDSWLLREGSQERSPRADWCGNGVQDLEQVLWIHAHRQASLAAGDQNLVELQGRFHPTQSYDSVFWPNGEMPPTT